MKFAKIVFKPLSPFSRLFTADQLWGQMVWAINELEGEDKASAFVKEFIDNPPFLISAMIPSGYLPRPVLPPIVSKNCLSEDEERKNREKAKKNKTNHWIPLDIFSLIQDDYSKISSIEIEKQPNFNEFKETHASINRQTLSALDGGLYNVSYLDTKEDLVVYLRFIDDVETSLPLIKRVISHWEKVNIGGDRAVGRGVFKISIEKLSTLEESIFNKDYVSFMTLSRCFGNDLIPNYYNLSVYSGIVGNGNTNGNLYFNKQPIIGFEQGSIFSSGRGCLGQNVNTDDRVCSYGYAFPIPFRL